MQGWLKRKVVTVADADYAMVPIKVVVDAKKTHES